MDRPDTEQRPYEGLDPGAVIAALESVGLLCDGRLLALNSFENRVYRVGQETGPALVAKFYRPRRWTDTAIIEEHAFCAELAQGGLSVVAPLNIDGRTLHDHAGFRFAVFPLQGGRAPELGVRENLRHLGQCLGRLHAIGARAPFRHRPTLSLAEQGDAAVDFILDGEWLPPELEENFSVLADALLDAAEQRWALAEPVANLRLHGDCHPGNVLWRDDQAHFVDLDDCCNGPAMQDIWMLLSGTAQEQAQQLEWLVEGYRVFAELNPMQLHLIEPLRTLRLLHYHAWIARRWHDPAFPAAFPWFGDSRHWEEVIGQMQEQLSALQDGD